MRLIAFYKATVAICRSIDLMASVTGMGNGQCSRDIPLPVRASSARRSLRDRIPIDIIANVSNNIYGIPD